MRIETDFIVLEGVMLVITVVAQTVFHPGFCFPAMGHTSRINGGSARGMSNFDMELKSGRVEQA